jgi:hypothetical protein
MVTHLPRWAGFLVDGLPIGLMLVGKHFDEATLYQAGNAFEKAGTEKRCKSGVACTALHAALISERGALVFLGGLDIQ